MARIKAQKAASDRGLLPFCGLSAATPDTAAVAFGKALRVSDDQATAVFRGYDTYVVGGQSRPDPERQWQVKLKLEAGRWKLLRQDSVDLQPGGPAP